MVFMKNTILKTGALLAVSALAFHLSFSSTESYIGEGNASVFEEMENSGEFVTGYKEQYINFLNLIAENEGTILDCGMENGKYYVRFEK